MPALIVSDDPPFVDRIAEKVRTLATVKPALVRLLEWQVDEALESTGESQKDAAQMSAGCRAATRDALSGDGDWKAR